MDTNILLDLYHLSGPDLEELRKLTKMVEKEKVELLVSSQVVDEFWRNRERVIADALKQFRESKAAAKVPNIIRIYPEAQDLKAVVDKANELVKLLTSKVTSDIEDDALKADGVIRELFSAIKVGDITDEIFERGKRRHELGNPPGKRDSLGDAVNWEWLLEQEISFWDDELVIISADGDYESELTKGKPREYLLREWKKRNAACELILEKSLTSFLLKYFPDIQLAEELDKLDEIERLEQSSTFASTHSAIAALDKYDDFKDAEVKRIVEAYLGNNQILWILGDPDVKAFAKKVLLLAKSKEAKQVAEQLQELVDKLDVDEEDDIPF
ncbi:MAG: PIN domain-containing protein [Thermostichus sp. BF3_bins_97]